jgi:mRNA interferase RelE/StbE
LAYRVEIHHTAQKQMQTFSPQVQVAIAQGIDLLAKMPRPAGCKKLRGTELWRLRLGRYRVVYSIDDTARLVVVVKVALRREDTYK